MRTIRRFRFEPSALAGGPTLIDRYLGRDDHARRGRWVGPPLDGVIEVALHDTCASTATIDTRDTVATIWHVLWVRDDAAASVAIGEDAWPIAPGDTVVVPPGEALYLEGRQLAVKIAIPGVETHPEPPTHGLERFAGYNRQTIYRQAGAIRLCRWKLTQPLALAAHHPGPVLTLALARDSTIRTSTAIDRLRQGELALIDPATNPTVAPDGLSYLLTIDRDPSTS